MALLDSILDANFRDEKAGRVVVFPGGRRHRGYVVKSKAEESKIRSFLKMFFFAQISILILGYLLASEWSRELNYALGRPALHLFRVMGISAGIYGVVVMVPYFLLWRSYKKAFLSFTTPQDEVLVTGKAPGQRARIQIAAVLIGFAVLFLIAGIWLTRAK